MIFMDRGPPNRRADEEPTTKADERRAGNAGAERSGDEKAGER
jgi:hypothetical protein